MDTELLHAFTTLNQKIDGHYQRLDDKIGEVKTDVNQHSIKFQKICDYINGQKEEETKDSENNNRKFYIAIALIGITFGTAQMIQGFM